MSSSMLPRPLALEQRGQHPAYYAALLQITARADQPGRKEFAEARKSTSR